MRSNKVVLIFSLLVLLGHGKKSDGNGKGNLEILTILQITNHSFPECGSKRPCAESHYNQNHSQVHLRYIILNQWTYKCKCTVFYQKPILASFTLGGPLISCDNPGAPVNNSKYQL